jgi:hypothetical protein
MKKSMVLSKSGRHLATSVVALLAIFYAVNFAQRPLYNWDMVAYIAVALIDSGQPADTAYRASHEAIARSVPPAVAERLKDTRNEHLIAADETRFAALLPFFTVKPVYPALIAALHRMGVDLVAASVAVSASSYALICILLYVWISRWVPLVVGVALAALLFLSPFLTPIGQLSSPDALSTLVILLALFLAIERQHRAAGAALLVVAIAVRPENILYCGIFLAYLAASRRMGLGKCLAFCGAAVAFYLLLTGRTNNYGWRTLFYFAMVDNTIAPAGFVSPLTFLDYLTIYLRQIDAIVFTTQDGFAFFALIGLGALCLKMKRRLWADRYVHLLILAALFTVARLAVLPSDASRALLPAYLLLTIVFIQACAELKTASIRP